MGDLAFGEAVDMGSHAIQFGADLKETPRIIDDHKFDFGHLFYFLLLRLVVFSVLFGARSLRKTNLIPLVKPNSPPVPIMTI